jgi:hypothetical protein
MSKGAVLKTRASKSPSLVWRVTPCGWMTVMNCTRRLSNDRRLLGASRRARGDSNVREGCKTTPKVRSRRPVFKMRASKPASLVWRGEC